MASIRRVSSFSTSKIHGNPIFSQVSSQTVDDDGNQSVMYFVIPPGKTEEDCLNSSLGEMYQTCDAHSLLVQWIEDNKCIEEEVECTDGTIFVFDSFERNSEGFKHLEAKMRNSSVRIEILGHQVLRQIFNAPEVLTFQSKSFPIFSLSMKQMIISLSGFSDKDEKDELEKLTKWMNGTISSSLTKAVTHVVTKSALTRKTQEANKGGIPVMTSTWIKEVWKDSKENIVVASDRRYVQHVCPAFYNVTVCLSQISAGRKATLKAGIERLGGKCLPDLVKGQTDVLVVSSPDGDKYKFARRWKIFCVTPEWVENSTESKHLLPTEEYSVSPNTSTNIDKCYISTPAHSHVPDLDFTRCSGIYDQSKAIVNATTNSNAYITRTEDDPSADLLAQLKDLKGCGAYLDGCKVYVVDNEKCEELKRVLNSAGAVRLNRLCDSVTHVIVTGHTLAQSVKEKLKELNNMPCLVTVEWILKSAQQGHPADEELYKFDADITLEQDSLANRQSSIPKEVSVGMTIQESVQKSSTSTTTTSEQVRKVSETVSHAHEESSRNNSVTPKSSKSGRTCDSDDTSLEETSENPTTTEIPSAGILSGVTFKISLSDQAECSFVKDIIESNGGEISKSNPDVVILPSVCDPVAKEGADKSYTKYWLFDCIENDSLDISSSFHYVPLPSFRKMQTVFKNVVIAVSQYSAAEREYIVEVVQALGGMSQDVFARKDAPEKKTFRSTHLICKNMYTDKTKAAKKWGVPVVIAEWAVDSFNGKDRLNEEKYNPEHQNVSDATVFMPTPQRKNNANIANTSVKSTYPASCRKGNPLQLINQEAMAAPAQLKQKEVPVQAKDKKTPDVEIKTTASAAPSNELPSSTKNLVQANAAKTNLQPSSSSNIHINKLPSNFTNAELERRLAELKALDPYTDESYQQLMDDIKARGVNLDDISPFTSFEDARLCNPNPDSPLIVGLSRHESRAVKEQFELAMQLSPIVNKISFKPSNTNNTPMSEIVKKFHACFNNSSDSINSQDTPKSNANYSPRASTPKSDPVHLRKIATTNRCSFGTAGSTRDSISMSDIGIKKLSNNKRPSDGPPEDENETNNPKRMRTSSEEEATTTKSHGVTEHENQAITTAKSPTQPPSAQKPNLMQALTDLIAEANNSSNNEKSPTKRRPGSDVGNFIPVPVPLNDDSDDSIEVPHLSWKDDSDQKKSTVKKIPPKAIVPQPQPPVEEVQTVRESRSRVSKLKKDPSSGNLDQPTGRITRATRSQSKNHQDVPHGHEPIAIEPGSSSSTGSRKKKSNSFPIAVPKCPVFMVSSLTEQDKAMVSEIVTQLNGKLSALLCYDANCVGLIAKNLMRSEKVLGCIASGKYILKMEYLHKCKEMGRFIPIEEEFLWNENNIVAEKERELARACNWWFKAQLEDKKKKPMYNMKFFFVDQPREKLAAYTRLVIAGGGQVVTDLKLATVIIMDDNSSEPTPVTSMPVKSPMYLNTLILSLE